MDEDESGSAPIAEWLLSEALHRAGRKDGIFVENVELTIDAVDLPRASLLEDLEAGNELSPRELRLLLESDRVDTCTVQEHIRGQLFEDE